MAANIVKVYSVGVQGVQGATGETGTSGTSGNTGTSGTSGINGTSGSSGSSGTSATLIPSQSSITASGTTISTTEILDYSIVNLISATSTDYAVRLPEPQLGGVVNIVNQSSVNISVFPYDSDDTILGQSAGAAYIIPPDGRLYQITCVQNPGQGVWSVAIPSSNNNVTRSVTIDLIATGSNPVSHISSFSMNAEEPLSATSQTFYPSSGTFSVLVPGSGLSYIDAPEFSQYNKVRISKFEILSNVPAGDLTNSPSQASYTLMGVTPQQFAYINASTINITITGSIGGSPTTPTEIWQLPFDELYSLYYNNTGASQLSYIEHYLPTATSPAPTGSALYQKITGVYPNGWQNGWQDLNSDHGERRVYLQANGFYGANSTGVKYTDYPSDFELKLQYNIEFEFAY